MAPTVFQLDGAQSTDIESPFETLSFAWDFEGDGVVDATGSQATHSFGAAGTFPVTLHVTDPGGAASSAVLDVVVRARSQVVNVTTPNDEANAAASPAQPGGAGLSLREAMAYANQQINPSTILVPDGFRISITAALPTITQSMDIVTGQTVVDGAAAGASADCFNIATSNVRISGFEIQNCPRSAVVSNQGDSLHLARLRVHDNGQPVQLVGTNLKVGPDNEFYGHAIALSFFGDGRIDQNYFHDNSDLSINLSQSASGSAIVGNVIVGGQLGLRVGNRAVGLKIVHNVVTETGAQAILFAASATDTRLHNNIFTHAGDYALSAGDGNFLGNSHNSYFENIAGSCSACTNLGTGSLFVDPEFVDRVGRDFRLLLGSPLINTGLDTLEDRNGSAVGGEYNGALPDIGAFEGP